MDVTPIEPVYDLKKVSDLTVETVELPHDQGVTLFQALETLLQLRAFHGSPDDRSFIFASSVMPATINGF